MSDIKPLTANQLEALRIIPTKAFVPYKTRGRTLPSLVAAGHLLLKIDQEGERLYRRTPSGTAAVAKAATPCV